MLIAIRARAGGRLPHRILLAVAVVGSTVSIAACGSAGKPGSTTSAHSPSHAASYAGCMRSHGVPNFPDPTPGSGFDIPSSVNTQSPAYTAAQHACAKLLPRPTAPSPPSKRQQDEMIAGAKCMRKHGINMADPTFHGRIITLDEPDQTTLESPAFKQAEAACHYTVPRSVDPAASP